MLMLHFIGRRTLQAILTLLVATLVVHVGVTVLPGDPVRALFGFRPPPPEIMEAIRERFHLNDPYIVQYWLYLRDILSLDLGRSLRFGDSVNELVATAWPYTARLVGVTLVLQVVVGLAGGLITAIWPNTLISRGIMFGAVSLIAVPVVLSTPVLQVVFGIRLHWFPISGIHDGWASYVLPVAALTAITLGTVIVFLRSELQQVLRSPFVRFAFASGHWRRRVVGVHALRAAFPTVITYLASNLGHIVLGLIIVEGVFNLPGLGGLVFGAIRSQDRSVVASLTLLITAGVIVINLVADILVAALDPRIRDAVASEGPP